MATATNEALANALAALESSAATAELSWATDLFGALNVIDENAALRRALTDPSREPEARAGLVRTLFGERIGDKAREVLEGLARSRFSTERDLGDTLELVAAITATTVAEKADGAAGLDKLQTELLGFVDLVASDHELQWALTDPQAPFDAKVELAQKLVPQASDVTRTLLAQAVSHPRGLRPTALVERFAEVAAHRQQRFIATVSVTRPLTDSQRERLQAGLNSMYGRELRLNEVIDPAVVGGVRIVVGDEVVDATAASRLADLRRKLAS